MEPYDMLPLEMWEEILARVEDPLDKWSLVSTNSQLQDAFLHCEVKWKFAGILQILLRNWYGPFGYGQMYYRDEHGLRWRDNQALFAGMRSCRGVNNLSCKVVDQYIEEHWQKFHGPPSFIDVYWSQQQIVQFLEQVENFPTDRNPILSRKIYGRCSFNVEGNHDLFVDLGPTDRQMLDLIARVGVHLRALNLSVNLNIRNPQRMCNFVQESLTSTPNLEQLSLQFDLMDNEEEAPLPVEVPPAPQNLVLPDLPRLEKISLFDGYFLESQPCIPSCISLKKYFPQLKRLSIGFRLWWDHYNYRNSEQVLFPKLEYLEIKQFDVWNQQEALFKLVYNLNVPMLKILQLWGSGPLDVELDECRKAVYFIEQIGLLTLKECTGGRMTYASGFINKKAFENRDNEGPSIERCYCGFIFL